MKLKINLFKITIQFKGVLYEQFLLSNDIGEVLSLLKWYKFNPLHAEFTDENHGYFICFSNQIHYFEINEL